MAITPGTWVAGSSGSPITVSVTNPSDTGDRMFECRFILEVRGTTPTSIACTYGGVTATLVTGSPQQSAAGNGNVYSYYILDVDLPAVGAQNAVLTFSGGSDYSGSVAATVHTGVEQAAPTRAGNYEEPAATVRVPAGAGTWNYTDGGAATVAAYGQAGGTTFTWSASWTERADADDFVAESRYGVADRTYSGASTDSVTVTSSSSQRLVAEVLVWAAAATTSAALTGTLISAAPIYARAGDVAGKTIIITLTGDTFVTPFTSTETDALTAGVDAATSPAAHWNATVRDAGTNQISWVRTSATIATGTIGTPTAAYAPTAAETLTVTVPAAVLTLAAPITATPTISIFRGPLLSATTGITNASGVLTWTISTDDANTANGEYIESTATFSPSITKRTSNRFA